LELSLDFSAASLCFLLPSIFERSAESFAFSSESLLSLLSSPKYLKANRKCVYSIIVQEDPDR
jgi:hypothetical protein